MAVWITGARGFIGRYVARACAKAGHSVAGLGHGAWPDAQREAWGVGEWRNGDISFANLDALASSLGTPELLVHLAGGSAVGPSFMQPAEDFRRSVLASSELAEWLRQRAPHTRLVMASSAAVYGGGHSGPITEAAPCTPYSPYGYHKRMAELVFESAARNFGLRMAVVRLFSVYGPGLRKQLLWDASARLAQRPAALKLGGHGSEQRDWLHVEDAADLLLRAAEVADANCLVFNGGTGFGTRIDDIAAALAEEWGLPRLPLAFSGVSRAGDPVSLVADTVRAQALGWQPQMNWRAGVAEYVRWYRSAAQEPQA